MAEIVKDKKFVAFCGLYCGACKRFIDKKCPGCRDNIKAAWCKVRTCCMGKNYQSCADCQEFAKASDCKKFNNIFSKFFALVFGSDRQACVDRIKETGYDSFAQEMAEKGSHTIKKK